MTIAEVIEGMLDLLNSPDTWCKHNSAKDVHGHDVDYNSDNAASWCLVGAMARVSYLEYGKIHKENPVLKFLVQRARQEFGVHSVPEANDYKLRDYEDMRMFLKRALLEAEELSA